MQRNVIERMKAVRLFVFDVDGVLTDGGIIHDGREEAKRFHVHDGAGMVAAMKDGYQVAWLTGRSSPAVTVRAEELGIAEVHQGVRDKVGAVEEMIARLGMTMEAVFFMGDDLNDLPLMATAGCAVAPKNACPDAVAAAHFVTRREAGRGAAREAIETVLRTQGRWSHVVALYRKRGTELRQ